MEKEEVPRHSRGECVMAVGRGCVWGDFGVLCTQCECGGVWSGPCGLLGVRRGVFGVQAACGGC